MNKSLLPLAVAGILGFGPAGLMAGSDLPGIPELTIDTEDCTNIWEPDTGPGCCGDEPCPPPGPSGGGGGPEEQPCSESGNPISVMLQTKLERRTDVQVSFPMNLSVQVHRTYSSGRFIHTTNELQDTYFPSFGTSWSLNLDTRLLRETGAENILLVLPNHRPRVFNPDPETSDRWKSRTTLNFLGIIDYDDVEDTYTLEMPQREKWVYNERGRLIRFEDPAGGVIYFERDLVENSDGYYIDRLEQITTNTGDPRYLSLNMIPRMSTRLAGSLCGTPIIHCSPRSSSPISIAR